MGVAGAGVRKKHTLREPNSCFEASSFLGAPPPVSIKSSQVWVFLGAVLGFFSGVYLFTGRKKASSTHASTSTNISQAAESSGSEL